MKRFYCTICKRVKRVRKYPANVAQVASENVMMRQGACSWHNPNYTKIVRQHTVKAGQ